MTQATDPSPLPLIPILLYTPILSMCTNFPPSVSSPPPNSFHSFLHLFYPLKLSLSHILLGLMFQSQRQMQRRP